MLRYNIPRWYQELSFSQIQRVLALGQVIKYDFNETVTGRTRKMLREIGVTSTFVKIPSTTMKKLFELSELDASRFLCEIYRCITGSYFVDEEYKKFYDCNERIVLSAIAILELSRTIIELHNRLPMGVPRYVAQKPTVQKPPPRQSSTSPYLEEQIEPPNWRQHKRETEDWRRKSNAIVLPQVILPKAYVNDQRRKSLLRSLTPQRMNFQAIRRKNRRKSRSRSREPKFTPPQLPRKKSPAIPSPKTRDEGLLLELLSKPKKYYPPGRENLSHKWQDWFYCLEADFEKLEREADCILNNIRATTQLICNSDVCTDCCGCSKVSEETGKCSKNLIDSIALDLEGNNRVIGAVVPDLSVESLSDSLLELPRIIPSSEKIVKTRVISEIVVDGAGQTRHVINESVKYTQYSARKIKYFPIPVKNVLPCACKKDVEQYCWMRNERNKIFIDFEKAYRERERKRELNNTSVDHLRKSREANYEKIVAVEEENSLQCAEPGKKCIMNHLKTIMRTIDEEKRLNCPRVMQDGEKLYKDNIKFAVGGISGNENNQIHYVLSGVTLHTPITITPDETSTSSSSQSNLPDTMSQHRHRSVILIPKARKNNSNLTEQPEQEFHQESINDLLKNLQNFNTLKTGTSPQEREYFNTENSSIEGVVDEEKTENTKSDVQTPKVDDKKRDRAVSIAPIAKKPTENIRNPENKFLLEEKKNDGENAGNEDNLENQGYLQETTKKDMISLMKLALNEMSEEGFLLARLPHSYKMPQLQAWAMFREGFVITEKLKQNLLEKTKQMWTSMESRKLEKIYPESLGKNVKLKNGSDIKKLKQEIKLKQQLFYSKVRKLRVLQSRTMWNLMNYEMFPCLTFKKAYYTYQASKEADGVVQRPYGVILSKT